MQIIKYLCVLLLITSCSYKKVTKISKHSVIQYKAYLAREVIEDCYDYTLDDGKVYHTGSFKRFDINDSILFIGSTMLNVKL